MSEVVSNPKRRRGRPPKAERKMEDILMEIDSERVPRIPGARIKGSCKVTVGGKVTDKCKTVSTPPCKIKTGDRNGKGQAIPHISQRQQEGTSCPEATSNRVPSTGTSQKTFE